MDDRTKKIKIKLIELGMKQRDIANELGVSEFHVSNLITGKRKSKKFDKWLKENLEEVA